MQSYVTFDQTPAVVVEGRQVKYGAITPPLEPKPELQVKLVCEFTICEVFCDSPFAVVGAGKAQ